MRSGECLGALRACPAMQAAGRSDWHNRRRRWRGRRRRSEVADSRDVQDSGSLRRGRHREVRLWVSSKLRLDGLVAEQRGDGAHTLQNATGSSRTDHAYAPPRHENQNSNKSGGTKRHGRERSNASLRIICRRLAPSPDPTQSDWRPWQPVRPTQLVTLHTVFIVKSS